jgi:hypothetical protein
LLLAIKSTLRRQPRRPIPTVLCDKKRGKAGDDFQFPAERFDERP